MKKPIYSLIATILISLNCFSNTPTLENDIDVKEENKVENSTLSKKEESKENESTKVNPTNLPTYRKSASTMLTLLTQDYD